MSNTTRLTAVMISKSQKNWLQLQKQKTGQPYSAIIRTLIEQAIQSTPSMDSTRQIDRLDATER